MVAVFLQNSLERIGLGSHLGGSGAMPFMNKQLRHVAFCSSFSSFFSAFVS
jgi:hypothetical protein